MAKVHWAGDRVPVEAGGLARQVPAVFLETKGAQDAAGAGRTAAARALVEVENNKCLPVLRMDTG